MDVGTIINTITGLLSFLKNFFTNSEQFEATAMKIVEIKPGQLKVVTIICGYSGKRPPSPEKTSHLVAKILAQLRATATSGLYGKAGLR